MKVAEGRRPERPAHAAVSGLSDTLWSTMEKAWSKDLSDRPSLIPFVVSLGHPIFGYIPWDSDNNASKLKAPAMSGLRLKQPPRRRYRNELDDFSSSNHGPLSDSKTPRPGICRRFFHNLGVWCSWRAISAVRRTPIGVLAYHVLCE